MSAGTARCVGTNNATVGVDGTRSYSVLYHVETSDPQDQSLTAMQAIGVPSFGDYYRAGNDSDGGAFVKSYSARLTQEDGSRKYWDVTVSYSTAGNTSDPNGSQGQFPENPWDAPPQISGSGVKSEELVKWHYNDPDAGTTEWLVNSANHWYDDEYREFSHRVLSISQAFKLSDFDLAGLSAYVDCVNDDTFFGEARDYYKMAAPRWRLLYTGGGVIYWDVQFEFEGKANGWNEQDRHISLRKIDEGYYYIDKTVPATPLLKRFSDDLDLGISGKGRLNGDGDRLKWDEQAVHYPPNGVNKYKRVDFADIGIPTAVEDLYG